MSPLYFYLKVRFYFYFVYCKTFEHLFTGAVEQVLSVFTLVGFIGSYYLFYTRKICSLTRSRCLPSFAPMGVVCGTRSFCNAAHFLQSVPSGAQPEVLLVVHVRPVYTTRSISRYFRHGSRPGHVQPG